jgi:hypothetical protein
MELTMSEEPKSSAQSLSQLQPQPQIHRIVSTVLHQIDVESKNCNLITISGDHSDLEGYLSDLLDEINEKEQKRAYDFVRETTEFYSALESYNQNRDLSTNRFASNIAMRLLDKEVETDKNYGHLSKSGKGHVKKGSFLQFLYRDGSSISYLGVKLEHQVFLDEVDFKRKIGLSVARKIYKACKVDFGADAVPHNVFVYDTNAKPSHYWWNDFLELKELRTDALNTETASKEVLREVDKLKKSFPRDHNVLRNATIAAFKQHGEMKYDEFIENTFSNYEPLDNDLKVMLPKIKEKLEKLPEKKNFDTRFTLAPELVTFRRSSYELSKEISLSIEGGIENINDKVWSEKTASGQELVVINSPEGFKRFTVKVRE